MNLKQRYAILSKNKEIIKEKCLSITETSGIYMFWRNTEELNSVCYIGQAKNLLERTAQHLMGRKQHIDLSLYKHKWYSEKNPFGWHLGLVDKCSIEELDGKEKYWIDYYKNKGFKLYNVTGGGQFDKAKDINERHEVKLKSYKNGKSIAEKKIKEQVRNYFDKYLDFVIKGKTNKTKERKFEEFKRWVYEETNKGDC